MYAELFLKWESLVAGVYLTIHINHSHIVSLLDRVWFYKQAISVFLELTKNIPLELLFTFCKALELWLKL